MNKQIQKIKQNFGLDDSESYYLASIGSDLPDAGYKNQTADDVAEAILDEALTQEKEDPDTSLDEHIDWVATHGLAWCTMAEREEEIRLSDEA